MSKETFAQLVRDAEETLYHVSKMILRNDADCADAVQEAVLIAFRRLDTLREEKYFKTWLIRIMINECYKISKKRKHLVPYEEYITEERAEEREDYTELYQAIKELPQELRVPVVLHYIEGFGLAEIEEITGVKQGTVKSRLSRARAMLKQSLGAQEVLV